MNDFYNQMDDSCKYPLKVWMTSVFIGPFLLLFNSKMSDVVSYFFSIGFLEFYFVAIIIGGLCSLPCFLFLWLCYNLLLRKQTSIWMIRWSLVIISLMCCISVFIIISLPDLTRFWKKGNVIMISSSALPLVAGLLVFSMENYDR